MTGPRLDKHDAVLREIDTRLTTLGSGALAASDAGAATQADINRQVEELARDRDELLQHWRLKEGVVAAEAPVRARACGSPQPCPHVLGLAEKYGVL